MSFCSETVFENAVIEVLQRNGWDEEVLEHPSEERLLENWAQILFENNRSQDRLGDIPLTSTEMDQIVEQILFLRTPLRLNEFINGRTVAITRDAPQAANVGSEVSLKIYDRLEIAGGQSRYQIARQPRYKASNAILPSRRGDLVLLINGMPVIHLELKRSSVPVSQAYHQIEKYAHEGIFTGLFSLVQVFVAMTPEQTRYFANPGPEGRFNPDFYFQWADFDNEPMNDWDRVVRSLLSIPMAHQLIGFYMVADRAAGVLMVMRSYQYNAANRIADRVIQKVWGDNEQRGGYIWHTTGSGKTVTSFKTAQLMADSQKADKVIFLLDRIELGTQSLKNYRSYGGDAIEVQDTASAQQLLTKLKDELSVLVVTSLQKMSLLNADEGLTVADLASLRRKRIVFVIDEAHRSTFGEMLMRIKETLPDALFFGFTGTPIHDENQRKHSTTATLFGDELHRYSIADGIRDQNVLGFDPEMVETYKASDLRKQVALSEARAETEVEALSDPAKKRVFNRFMDKKQVPMATRTGPSGRAMRGIEDYLSSAQYHRSEHREAVASDIAEHWVALSQNSKFHAILATSSIPEAIEYYRIFKQQHLQLAVTALFDPNIDNTGGYQIFKEDGLVEILTDYNSKYGQSFSMTTHDLFKADVAARLAHKEPHHLPDFTPDKQIDLLIVVDQMLTGFDSKWLNTLYLDKVLEYENIIQAFSRTNRIFGPDKPFGSIRYYRRPHTMKTNIDRAVELYSGHKPMGLFVEHLDGHLEKINDCFTQITKLFGGEEGFAILPASGADQGEFAKVFSELYHELQAALIQGFTWDKQEYRFDNPRRVITVELTENDYLTLVTRYKELMEGSGGGGDSHQVPAFEIDTHITHIDTDRIDSDYLNDKFTKYIRARESGLQADELKALLEEVHDGFARLSRDEQVFANVWLHDVASGDAILVEGKTVQDYINEYKQSHQDRQIDQLVRALGVEAKQVRALLAAHVTEANIDEYGRFTALKASVDGTLAKSYLEHREGRSVSTFFVNREVEKLLRAFILRDELPEDLDVSKAMTAQGDGKA